MSEISAKLIKWFQQNQRILPWRDNPEPYRVWISEIMLQQTRVQAVIPFYERFLDRFPGIKALADSSLEEVLLAWQGLGYYARAKNLHQAARQMRDNYGCRFPDTYQEVLNLPGIGKYTAAAILSIAFDQPYPVIDGNVLRVMARLYGIETDIRLPKTETLINTHLNKIFPVTQASAFNQGMMELGALICLPKQPKCDECPFISDCQAYQEGKQTELPLRAANAKPLVVKRIIPLIRKGDSILLHLRQSTGLLASMWEFPGIESGVKEAASHFREEYGMEIKIGRKLFDAEHVFTHRHWKMSIYEGTLLQDTTLDDNKFKWARADELQNYPIPNAFKAIVGYLK